MCFPLVTPVKLPGNQCSSTGTVMVITVPSLVFPGTNPEPSFRQPGSKNQKHVLRPESLEGTDEEDPVTALEWDPLSTDYLLVANLHNGIRLVDSESLCCITTFSFPSAAASVQCLAWVPSAPGMFITGGIPPFP